MAQSKLASILSPSGGSGADNTSAAEFRQLFEMYKNGIPDSTGQKVTWGRAYQTALSMLKTNKDNPEFKSVVSDLESFVPVNAQTVFETFKKTLNATNGEWQKTPEGRVAGTWMLDAFGDFAKNNPTASQEQFQKAATDIQMVYKAGELGFIRGKKVEEGLLNPASKTMYEIGAAAQTGKLDAAVNIDPAIGNIQIAPIAEARYQQWSAWESKVAADKYGLSGLVPRTQEDGSQYLEGPDGKKFRFDYQNGEQVLRTEDGSVVKPKETPADRAAQAEKKVAMSEDFSAAQTDIANARNPSDRKAKIDYWIKRKVLTLDDVTALGYTADGNKTSYSAMPKGTK